MRRRRIAACLRLQKQPVQREEPCIVAARHGLERLFGGGTIAGELGSLGAKQQRERLAGRDALCLVGEFLRRLGVARADRDEALRYSSVSPHSALIAQV